MRLFEFGQGDRVTQQYKYLYHLTTYFGLENILNSNTIKGAGYVSTTWNKRMNHVVGKRIAFSLVLDGATILGEYANLFISGRRKFQ